MKLKFKVLPLVFTALIMSCATTIPVRVTVPPELNYNKANSVGVLPVTTAEQEAASILRGDRLFFWYRNSNDLTEELILASYMTSRIEELLTHSGYFKVVSSDQLKREVEVGDISVDALISGKITNISNSMEDGFHTKKDRNGEITKIYYVKRKTQLDVSFKIIDPVDFTIIDTFSATSYAQSEGPDWNKLKTFETLQRQAADSLIDSYRYHFVPRTYTEYRSMAKLANKNDIRIDKIDQLINNGFYKEAQDIYLQIYNETGDVNAKYNAILIREILGDLDGALVEMTEYAKESGDSKAMQSIRRMKQAVANREALKK